MLLYLECRPNSPLFPLIYQPQELVPFHPVYNVQDWDDPEGAIDWPRLRSSLAAVKETGKLPDSHYSHDHLNEQVEVPVPGDNIEKWKSTFEELAKRHKEAFGEELSFAVLDGFLLFWDKVRYHPLLVAPLLERL